MRHFFGFLFLMILASEAYGQAPTYDFVLNGRLTDTSGKPVDGPIAMSVKFYHVATGGTPVLVVTTGLESVALTEGVFHIRLVLGASDYSAVFPRASQATYFEVTDLTNAANSPYERSQVTMLPYAAKVPVNENIFAFDPSNGKMTFAATPSTGKYLKANSDGTLSWDSPGSSSSADTYTNKIINADNNTITNISDTNIKASAAIADSKLATISTAGKVSGAAITSGTIAGSTAVSTSGDIATTGNVGIGGAAGTAKLQINTGAAATKGLIVQGAASQTANLQEWQNSAGTVMAYLGSTGGFVANTGNVSNVIANLTFYNNTFGSGSGPININPNTNGNSSMVVGAGGTDATASLQAKAAQTGNLFETKNAAGTVLDVIDINGNVGIGTTTPGTKLEVSESTATAATPSGRFNRWIGTPSNNLNFTNLSVNSSFDADFTTAPNSGLIGLFNYFSANTAGSNTSGYNKALYNQVKTTGGSGSIAGLVVNDNAFEKSAGSVAFTTLNILNAATAIYGGSGNISDLSYVKVTPGITTGAGNYTGTITNQYGVNIANVTGATNNYSIYSAGGTMYHAGKVGIGTLNPIRSLHVMDATATNIPAARFEYSSGDGAIEILGNTVSSDSIYFGTVASPALGFIQYRNDTAASGPNAMTFGTASAERMRIDSAGKVGIGTTSPSQKLSVGASGDGSVAIANSWTTYSDKRLKKDISLIDNALDKISKLAGYFFYWKKGSDDSRQVGVMAQEVEEIFPEVVKTGSDGIKSVDYPKLVAPMIEAIKELRSQKDREISQLKADNDAMRVVLCEIRPDASFCTK